MSLTSLCLMQWQQPVRFEFRSGYKIVRTWGSDLDLTPWWKWDSVRWSQDFSSLTRCFTDVRLKRNNNNNNKEAVWVQGNPLVICSFFDQTEIEENDFTTAEWALKALSNSSFFKYHNIKAQKRRTKRIYPYLHFESDIRSNTRNLSLITLPSGIETL